MEVGGFTSAWLSAYSTSLNFFNFLSEHPDSIVVIDDAAGIFNDLKSMAILKAATWPQGGGKRIIKWGSTSGKVLQSEFEFRGRFVVICNSFPSTPDGEAIKSRGFGWRIDVTPSDAKKLLKEAARDKSRYPITETAVSVARFLCDRLNAQTVSKINFRTLGKGYQLAKVHPESWQRLLLAMLPDEVVDPLKLVKELDKQGLKVKDQAAVFEKLTRLKIRSFYKYRASAGLSR